MSLRWLNRSPEAFYIKQESADLRQSKSGPDPDLDDPDPYQDSGSIRFSKCNLNVCVPRFVIKFLRGYDQFSRNVCEIVGKMPYLALLKIFLRFVGPMPDAKFNLFFLVYRCISGNILMKIQSVIWLLWQLP